MKTTIRSKIFETNSSSTHTLALVSKSDYTADRAAPKPKFKRYVSLTDKYDKLLMACGCCHELFYDPRPDDDGGRFDEFGIDPYCEDLDPGAAKTPLTYARLAEDKELEHLYIMSSDVTYSFAIEILTGVYCSLTGKDQEHVKNTVNGNNKCGRACHMKFFEEGALYDAESDYYPIYRLFEGTVKTVLAAVRNYFDDDTVLCYREYYQGYGYGEDDD